MAVAAREDADADTRVRVICRVRPRAPGEVGDGQYAECLQVESAESFVRVTKNAWDRPEAFAFDAVLPVNASQRRVYDAVCMPVVEAVLGGANGGARRVVTATARARRKTRRASVYDRRTRA